MKKRYCVKCKDRTQTNDYKLKDKLVERTKKNDEISSSIRKIITGTCSICGSKKHLFTSNNDKHDYELKPKNEELDSIRHSILKELDEDKKRNQVDLNYILEIQHKKI
jgi:hypothetical protein